MRSGGCENQRAPPLKIIKMQALICTAPGVLEYRDLPLPQAQPGQAIIKIKRIGICGTDLHAFEGTQPYFSYPRILGHELAGELAAVDKAVQMRIGDAVTLIPYLSCNQCIACRTGKPNCCANILVCGVHTDGGMVEYLAVPATALIPGEGLSLDQLALVEPLAIGAHGVRRAAITEEDVVLVIGAGPIGLGAMAFAQIRGATVIAMDVNESRLQFCRNNFNIPYTLNARESNVLEALKELTIGDMATVVIDATGNQKAINNALPFLAHGGRFVLIGLQKEAISFSHPEFHKREATLMSSRNATREDFQYVMQCMKNGSVRPEAFITHRVPFDEVASVFNTWLNPETSVIKAMVEIP
jgi:2-desacetyl-2-hydroxyethyl bacteriochlorophyllide A dehydrogenase